MEEKNYQSLSYFDRMSGTLHGLPDVVHSRPTTMRVVPPLGLGTHTYIVQTFRQRDMGDTIFLEVASEGNITRIVIPPAIADTIARQRDQLTTQSRSRAGVRRAEDMKARGIEPGFMKSKGGKS
jgi:hypothetical protein